MKICVVGLWHLGTVVAACLASAGHDVTGVDADAGVVSSLAAGTPPLVEPGLADLVASGLAAGRLGFTTDASAVAGADLVWIASDTPVDDDDQADVEQVVDGAVRLFAHLKDGALVVVSSQLPVGTTRRLADLFARGANGRAVGFACSPENLRLGRAIEAFTRAERVVVGVDREADRDVLQAVFQPFTPEIVWMSIESAEMTKHAINAFLATSIAFTNEVATLCEEVGADAGDVARGLMSESRIGPRAYVSPGGAFAGGTLARDIVFLAGLGREHHVATPLLSAVKTSNDAHRQWAERRLDALLAGVAGKTVAVWGLTYKAGTSTLRRSSAVELCRWLVERGATVRAHDPVVRVLSGDLAGRVTLAGDAPAALVDADALVVATPWPEYRDVDVAVAARMRRPLVLDAGRFLGATFGAGARIEYVSVGRQR